jgi:thiol peroxidase
MKKSLISVVFAAMTAACTHGSGKSDVQAGFEVSRDAVAPGSEVLMRGNKVELYKGSLKVGDQLATKLDGYKADGKVAIINIVPSVDTPVCEAQTHELGESGAIPAEVRRITVSRDLPMAQSRFAKEANLTNVEYVSDYKFGTFGRESGLLMKGPELLARAVLVVDKDGIVRHIQVVPDVTKLPDLGAAIAVARKYL